jgi:predicted  nucleic acid-binding Zn-ribbon protein
MAVPVVGVAAMVGVLVSQPAVNKSSATEITFGQGDASEAETLLRAGSCELIRQTVDERTEALSVSREGGSCSARIEFSAEKSTDGTKAQTDPRFPQTLDAESADGVRTVEIVRPGTYTVKVSDGSVEQTVSIVVRDPS